MATPLATWSVRRGVTPNEASADILNADLPDWAEASSALVDLLESEIDDARDSGDVDSESELVALANEYEAAARREPGVPFAGQAGQFWYFITAANPLRD